MTRPTKIDRFYWAEHVGWAALSKPNKQPTTGDITSSPFYDSYALAWEFILRVLVGLLRPSK